MKIWAFSLCWLLGAALPAATVRIDVWQADCSVSGEGAVRAALKGAARLFEPCHLNVELGSYQALAAPAACSLPLGAKERAPLLAALAKRPRAQNPGGLSLFILPTQQRAGGDTRYSFSIVEKSKGAACGDPEPRFIQRFGSLFMTDFSFQTQDQDFTALLLAHEIAHELTQRSHPTHAPRGSLLADHLTDLGTQIPASDCACMRLSPYIKKKP